MSEKQKEWTELWVEGFSTTGETGKALFVGMFLVDVENPIKDAATQWRDSLPPKRAILIDTEAKPPTYWGSRMFDNGNAAQEMFG